MASSTIWKKLLQTSMSQQTARFMQLATVKPDGRPANRTVVFRGFLGETAKISFVTDSRSNKVEEINKSPFAEICWYFPDTREQFRLSGDLALVMHGCQDPEGLQARQEAWGKLSDATREQFVWPNPGELVTSSKGSEQEPIPGPEETPPKTFCLAALDVAEVDYLQLKPCKRTKFSKSPNGEWLLTNINP